MGRAKYTEQERHRIILHFLTCARTLLEEDGIEQVTIRRIAQCAGCTSTTLYQYFEDVDEILCLASMSYLESCYRELLGELPGLHSPYEIYLRSCRIYSLHAFSHPQIFRHLLFRTHSRSLHDTIARYYEDIYPGLPAAKGEAVLKMLSDGDFLGHNVRVLRPLSTACGLSEAENRLLGDVTTAYFKMLLDESCAGTHPPQVQVQRMQELVAFLLREKYEKHQPQCG